MKKRRLLTNIFYVVMLLALVAFLAVEFTMMDKPGGKALAVVALAVAVISVALVDIVFPILDNKDMLSNKKYLALVIVKSVVFLAAVVALFLFEPLRIIDNTVVGIVVFIVLYFIQFFISLDPKVEKIVDTAEDDDEDEPVEEIVEKIDDEITDEEIGELDELEEDDVEKTEFKIDFND